MSPTNVVPLRRAMGPRDPHESHRVSSPLELLFDLVFVAAIASAAAQWHHGLAEGHLGDLLGFAMVFFAIWWAWMNYTWFASAYEVDDVGYRLLTFGIMSGSLMLAAGVPDLFDDGSSGLVVAGYVVMRLGMVGLWLRAAAGHPEGRSTARRYAVGISGVQVLWVARLLVHDEAWLVGTFFVLMALELLVPIVAERHRTTTFHPHHIAERYGLLTIIVLGEVVLASLQAVQGALGEGVGGPLVMVVVGALLIVFSYWWLYFKHDEGELFARSARWTFLVGYGHYVVYAAVASTGAALAAAVDVVQHEAHASERLIGVVLAVGAAVYVWILSAIHALGEGQVALAGPGAVVGVGVIVVSVVSPSIGATVLLIGLVLAGAVAQYVWTTHLVRDPLLS